jgi:hypothetical protein
MKVKVNYASKCESGPYGRLWGWWLYRVSFVPQSSARQPRALTCAMQSGLPLSPSSLHPTLPDTDKTCLGSLPQITSVRSSDGCTWAKITSWQGEPNFVSMHLRRHQDVRVGFMYNRSVFSSPGRTFKHVCILSCFAKPTRNEGFCLQVTCLYCNSCFLCLIQ